MAEIRPVPVPRPEWSPLPHTGCVNVDGKVLLRDKPVSLALLRFGQRATIHEHDARIDIDVICLEGNGYVSVDGEAAVLQAGERLRWPAGCMHRLWTETSTMLTLMIEYIPPEFPPPSP